MNLELHGFVREALARGLDRAAIRQALERAGWPAEEIDAGLAAYADVDFPIPVPRPRPYLSAREAFLYLVLFATLYATAYNVGVVLFQLVHLWFPEPGQMGETPRMAADAARGATAGLIIAFPIFALVARSIGRAVTAQPEKRGSRVRKWLTYLTLFVAAMVLIGDLTFLVFRLLSGELPARVLFKVVVVFAIAGTVFSHYLAALRGDEREGGPAQRALRLPPRLVGAAVVLVTLVGLFLGGSPRSERQRQLDVQRIGDLQAISQRVSAWSRDRRRVPASLDELAADPEVVGLRLVDPASGAPYGYRMLDSLRYELCATFDAEDPTGATRDPLRPARFWQHAAGHACFTLEAPPAPRDAEPPGPRRP